MFTLFSIWFFIIYISYISYKLLSQSGKHSVDLISATSRRFWAYCFLEIKEWIPLWYPKNPIGCSWGSKNIWCSRIWGRIFVSWKYFLYIFVDNISFSFYIKYIRRKCYKNFFGHIFLGSHTTQTLTKYIWMWHCLYWFTLSSYLFSFAVFAWSCCFNSSIIVIVPFFFVVLPFKFLIFFFPPYLSSLVTF